MRIYVDELPKDCEECPCCNKDVDYGYCCNLGAYEYDDYFCINKKHPRCPIQSLTDYTKQVRKEVCEEIKDISELFGVCKTGIIKEEYRIDKDVLDQIQGER